MAVGEGGEVNVGVELCHAPNYISWAPILNSVHYALLLSLSITFKSFLFLSLVNPASASMFANSSNQIQAPSIQLFRSLNYEVSSVFLSYPTDQLIIFFAASAPQEAAKSH